MVEASFRVTHKMHETEEMNESKFERYLKVTSAHNKAGNE